MGEISKIEWTDATFNPWRGCRALSPACDNCYAKTLVEGRLGESFDARTRAAESTWKQPLAWNRKAAKEGRRMRVFCASLADVFDAEVPDDWRDDLFALIAATPHLDWLLLTKRPAVARKYLTDRYAKPAPWFEANHRLGTTLKNSAGSIYIKAVCARGQFENVWLGTTVENQAMAEARIPHLLATPAAVRFLSMEPLLGPVDLTWCNACHSSQDDFCNGCHATRPLKKLDWVIAGGESGPGARPTHPEWFRSIRDQCAAAGVPFLFKQHGEWTEYSGGDVYPGKAPERRWVDPRGEGHWPGPQDSDCLMARVGKKAAGRLLDGVLHDALPAVRS